MFSNKMENLITKIRVLINSVIFGTATPKTICTDHNKPLSVPHGADSLMVQLNPHFFSREVLQNNFKIIKISGLSKN